MRIRLLVTAALPLWLTTCDAGTDPKCGDGITTHPEQCDDGNTQAGDGCSAVCENEDEPANAKLTCRDVFQSSTAASRVLTMTSTGLLVLAGDIQHSPTSPQIGWVGAFDPDGEMQWVIELEEQSFVEALIPRGDELVGLASSIYDSAILRIGPTGELLGQSLLPKINGLTPGPNDLLDTPQGLLLAGSLQEDLWLGRLDVNGQFETLFLEDFAGLTDRFMDLHVNGDQIGALAIVGVENFDDEDVVYANRDDVHLFVYDHQLEQVHRTVLTSGEPRVALSGQSLSAIDNRWIIAGFKHHATDVFVYGVHGWAAAVEDDAVIWAMSTPGSVTSSSPRPHALFATVGTLGPNVVLGGRQSVDSTSQRWLLGINPMDGSMIWEQTGDENGVMLSDGFESYTRSTMSSDRTWFSGVSENSGVASQWLCNVGS